MSKPVDLPANDSLWQEIIKVRESIPHTGLYLFLDMVPSSSEYVTRGLRGCFLEGSVLCRFVSFQSKEKPSTR